jgi:hypothetical protein
MPRVGQGGTATLHSDVTDTDGNPADATALSVTVLDPLDAIVPGFPISLGSMVHDGTGLYHYDWVVDSMQPVGTYRAEWDGATIDGPVTGYEEWIVSLPGTIGFGTAGPIPDAYLSPGRFGLMRMGSKLPPSDVEMVNVLQEASAMVDAYCVVPREFTFFGGTVTDEEHRWRYPLTNMDVGQRRIYPLRKPLLEPIIGLKIEVSAGAFAQLPVSALVTNKIENWVEVTSLALASSSGLFGVTGWVVPIGGLANPLALLSYNYGKAYIETDRRLVLTNVAGTYQSPHGSWTSDTVVVRANGTVVDPVGAHPYVTDLDNGWIIFTGTVPTGLLTVSYVHLLPREIPLATAMIAGHLLGDSALRAKGMQGLAQIKAGEIMLSKGRVPPTASNLDITVPDAALLLAGYRFWTWG